MGHALSTQAGSVRDLDSTRGASRVLVLACSQRKFPKAGRAIDVYNGPLFGIVRRYNRSGAEDVYTWIVSAEHGLLEANESIRPYDRRLSHGAMPELRVRVLDRIRSLVPKQVDAICICVPKAYTEVLPIAWLRGTCPDLVTLDGSRGEKMTSLKSWLWQTPMVSSQRGTPSARLSGPFSEEHVVTGPDAWTAAANRALQRQLKRGQFSARYSARINGVVVPAKCLASELSGLNARLFDTHQAIGYLKMCGLVDFLVTEGLD